jgi:hypothetical protein
MPKLPDALAPLGAYNQFILYNADGVPTDPKTLKKIDPHLPVSWMDADTAITLGKSTGLGVGFVFTDNDPFFFFDIDDCLVNGQWSELSRTICKQFAGCAVEVSKSGEGLHIFGTGNPAHLRCKNNKLGIEFYTNKRYAALTGFNMSGSILHTPPDLQSIIDTYFFGEAPEPFEWSDGPVEEWNGPQDDKELIKKALGSKKNPFTNRPSFKELWTMDLDALGRQYPHPKGTEPFDYSSADAALLQHLAFWTGKDCERMDRLFRQSALMREKWDIREDYRIRSIEHATGLCKNVYSSIKKPVEPVKESDIIPYTIRNSFQYLAAEQQIQHFEGCTYVRDVHRIFTKDGALLKPEQFKAAYGGYTFALDTINGKTTRNAWDAFTESQAVHFPKVQGLCFRPELEPYTIIQEENRALINTYVPVYTERKEGDVRPFLNHLNLILPVQRDQNILLAWMAACVQYPGVKFQWAPLLQGIEGNGKTLFINCLTAAIGHKYTHLPNASDLGQNGSKFNAWLQNKLFIGIEDVYIGDRREVLNALKPLITNSRIEIQGKGVDQITGDNRANFFLCANEKTALLKTKGDRRYCIFFTAQQEIEDMAASGFTNTNGMSSGYFSRLYGWLKGGGYAIVNHFLRAYSIPDELNPATHCQRAPITSSTDEAIFVSLGRIEQDVMEAIEEGQPGFCGGWVSSMAFNRFLETRRDNKMIPHNKRKDLLKALGYIPHPGLRDGRSTKFILSEGGKPRLYIKKGSIEANIADPAMIVDKYNAAQGYAVTDTKGGLNSAGY